MFWILAILLVMAATGALFFGLRRPAPATPDDAARAFFRDRLEGIDRDVAGGRLSEAEAAAARAELAREVIRFEKENPAPPLGGKGRAAILLALPVVAAGSLALYGWIGRADLPAQPLAGRELPPAMGEISLEAAVERVEQQMVQTPNDIRGWLVLGPIYMEQGRYAEAANAWRRVLDLEPPTPDRQTNLAEALILASDGEATEEALDLLRSAAEADPGHVRSRFYLAGELTRGGEYADAVAAWEELIGLATGEEPWVGTARAGLAAAQAGLTGQTLGDVPPDATTEVMIRGMVDGLAARLYEEGGSAEEWMQLVRSRLTLDGEQAARADLERGLEALSGLDRVALADFGTELGLTE